MKYFDEFRIILFLGRSTFFYSCFFSLVLCQLAYMHVCICVPLIHTGTPYFVHAQDITSKGNAPKKEDPHRLNLSNPRF